ncbi:hypothetical protein [Embleya scabrispora]|nr:hypothetical protein [Embleya scabrispora]MYS82506.1 hypothetical protein [Streptomyces sp. SID5474]
MRFRRGQYVVAGSGYARTVVADAAEPTHQQVPHCRELHVIEHPDTR